MKYHAPYGSTDSNASYVDRNTPAAVRGSAVPALAIEEPQRELVDVIARSGMAPANELQLSHALQTGRINYGEAAGTENALILTLSPPPLSLGSIVGSPLRVKIALTNTGPATININGLGVVPIIRSDGSALKPADQVSGMIADLRFDGLKCRLQNPQSISGLFSRITDAPTATYAITPTDSGTLYKNYVSGAVAQSTIYNLPFADQFTGGVIGILNNSLGGATINAKNILSHDLILVPGKTGISQLQLTNIWSYIYLVSDGSNWLPLSASADVMGDITKNLASGFVKHPSGLLEQWGSITVPAASTLNVTFPIAYTSGSYAVSVSPSDTSQSNYRYSASPVSLSQFSITNTSSASVSGRWKSIGY